MSKYRLKEREALLKSIEELKKEIEKLLEAKGVDESEITSKCQMLDEMLKKYQGMGQG